MKFGQRAKLKFMRTGWACDDGATWGVLVIAKDKWLTSIYYEQVSG